MRAAGVSTRIWRTKGKEVEMADSMLKRKLLLASRTSLADKIERLRMKNADLKYS